MARLPLCAPTDTLFALLLHHAELMELNLHPLLPGQSTNRRRHAFEPTTDTNWALVIDDTARTPLTGGGKHHHP